MSDEVVQSNGVVQYNEFTTNDMTFAAYLKMRGCKLLAAKKMGETFKFVFVQPGNIEQLKIDLVNSEIVRFDAAVRDLKRLVYSSNKKKPRDR